MSWDYKELKQLDHTHLWHPFAQMQEWMGEELLIIERGEGSYLVDIHGRKYIDGVSSLWCNLYGHRRKELDEAIRNQLDRIAHTTFLGLSHVPGITLAQKLSEIAPPGLQRVFYSDSGSTAVEVALKMAFQYWQLKGEKNRTRFASLAEAYHGDTVGAMSVGYSEVFHRFHRPLLFPAPRIRGSMTKAAREFLSLESCSSASSMAAFRASCSLILWRQRKTWGGLMRSAGNRSGR